MRNIDTQELKNYINNKQIDYRAALARLDPATAATEIARIQGRSALANDLLEYVAKLGESS